MAYALFIVAALIASSGFIPILIHARDNKKGIFPDGVEILEYSILHGSDRDDVISSIINKINSSELRVSGENNNEIWEKGWGEILDSVSKDFHPNKLMPQYFDHHKIMRFEGNYIIGITENFVYKFL